MRLISPNSRASGASSQLSRSVADSTSFDRSAGFFRVQLVDAALGLHDVLGVDLEVGRRTLQHAGDQRLVDQKLRVGQCQPVFLLGGQRDDRTHARREPGHQRDDLRLDEPRGIKDGEAGRDFTARAIDVQVDRLVGRFALQRQHLPVHLVRELRRYGPRDLNVAAFVDPLVQRSEETVSPYRQATTDAPPLFRPFWSPVKTGAMARIPQISRRLRPLLLLGVPQAGQCLFDLGKNCGVVDRRGHPERLRISDLLHRTAQDLPGSGLRQAFDHRRLLEGRDGFRSARAPSE